MSKTIENLKTGNYKVVDNQGVSVTIHFLECLEKEFADLEAKLAEMTKKYELASCPTGGLVDRVRNLEQQLAEKENMHLLDEKEFQHYCAYKHIEPEIKGCLDREREYEKQLVEKDKEIERLNHKLNIEEPCLIRNYKDMLEQLIQSHTQLEQEIEKLKQQYIILENENNKLATTSIIDKYKEAQKEVSFGKQLAIQELEKVKTLIQNAINFEKPNFVEVYDAINKQINDLRGEKDE